jgi:hypothetical protein
MCRRRRRENGRQQGHSRFNQSSAGNALNKKGNETMKKLLTITTMMRTTVNYSSVIALAVMMASCATPYTNNGLLGGYSDTTLAPDVYRVSFQGNGYTSSETTRDFALLRAADLTRSHGYRYFGIVNEADGGQSGVINTPGTSFTSMSAQRVGNAVYGNATTTFIPGASIPFFFPKSGLLIRCFKERPPAAFVLDGEFVASSLREKYHI